MNSNNRTRNLATRNRLNAPCMSSYTITAVPSLRPAVGRVAREHHEDSEEMLVGEITNPNSKNNAPVDIGGDSGAYRLLRRSPGAPRATTASLATVTPMSSPPTRMVCPSSAW